MKQSNKLTKPIYEIANEFAGRLIATYNVKNAEKIAKLIYEKIIASRKSLERRYGKDR